MQHSTRINRLTPLVRPHFVAEAYHPALFVIQQMRYDLPWREKYPSSRKIDVVADMRTVRHMDFAC